MREYLILHMIALALGIVLDILIGDSHGFPHPVRAIGTLVAVLEKKLNVATEAEEKKKAKILRGSFMWLLVTVISVAVTVILLICAYMINTYLGLFVETVLTYYILAAGSLRDESMKVYHALTPAKNSEITRDNSHPGPDPGVPADDDTRIRNARTCLSMIVGRDTERLDENGIIRATVETVAENTSDGVIAPLIYTAVAGPALGMLYKAVNTMDSMTGYHNERYEYFGRIPAKADDVFNFVPSRLSALFLITGAAIAGMTDKIRYRGRKKRQKYTYDAKNAFRIWRRDRFNHKSPNSAQTESAGAGALGIRLGGSAYYGGSLVEKPYIGDDMRPVVREDIRRQIRLMFYSEAVCTAVIYIIMMLILIFP